MKRRRGRLAVKIGIALAVVVVLAPVFAFFCPVGKPTPFRRAQDDRIVAAIRSGALRPDRQGVVLLPAPLAGASINGRAYVSRPAPGRLVVFLPSWVGRTTLWDPLEGDSWVLGYIYDSSAPADNQAEWETHGPAVTDPWHAPHDTRTDEWKWDLFPYERLSAHWYMVAPFS